MATDDSYEPWRPVEFPRLKREIVRASWLHGQLRIEVSEGGVQPPAFAVSFNLVRAYQGLDEGYRLLDSPDWSGTRALIYSSRNSQYLVSVKENAAGMLDNMDVVHWMITSCNECVDVITECEPRIDMLPV